MFCGNCGANNPEGSSVCGSCGAALTPEESSAGSIMDKVPGGNKKMVGIIAAVVAAVVVLAVVAGILFGVVIPNFGPKGAAKKFVMATLNGKGGGKTIVSMIPDELIEEALDNNDDFDTKKEMIQEIDDALEEIKDEGEDEYGKYKVKVEVRKVSDWNKKEINAYNDRLDDLDYNMQIKDGANVKLHVTVNGKDGKDSSTMTVPMIKVGGKWYVDVLGTSIPGI